MNQEEIDKFIQHYGVKGMHWGIRNEKKAGRPSSDYRKTKPYRNRKTHELTNKQLKAVNERINLEQNYRRLNPSKVKIGMGVAASILAALDMGTRFYSFIKSPAGQALAKNGKKFVSKKLA